MMRFAIGWGTVIAGIGRSVIMDGNGTETGEESDRRQGLASALDMDGKEVRKVSL
jgi:hypothetical protein